MSDFLKLVSAEMKVRQARTDLGHLTEAEYLQRIGTGLAMIYVRTSKRVPELPGE